MTSNSYNISPISPAVKSGKQSRPNLDGMFDVEYDDDEMITSLNIRDINRNSPNELFNVAHGNNGNNGNNSLSRNNSINKNDLIIPDVSVTPNDMMKTTTPTKKINFSESNNGELDLSNSSNSKNGSARKKGMLRSSTVSQTSVASGVEINSLRRSLPNTYQLPGSVDDEIGDPHAVFVTSVDLSLINNAAGNALEFLLKKEKDEEVEVNSNNCIRPLICTAQNYAWGKLGSDSLVAKMKNNQHLPNDNEDDECKFEIDNDKPYAELWIGTHPNGMSKIIMNNSNDNENGNGENPEESEQEQQEQEQQIIPLLDYVRTSPEMHCGVDGVTGPSDKYDITFLFKVLSIEKVLSIQAHPDKRLAAQLHSTKPNNYKDPNHKPEMAVSLTDDFEAMCGFRPITEIATHFEKYPEFALLIDNKAKEQLCTSAKRRVLFPRRKELYDVFKSYMECTQETISKQLDLLLDRLNAIPTSELTDTEELIIRLSKQFPNDCGIFAPLLFNHLKLKKGDAFFISANEPHAYIYGEILECMACSDNVVRAGLTPKVKDVDTLCNMLTYKTFLPEITRGIEYDEYCILYKPPVDDFAIEVITIPPGESYTLNNVRSPSVILTLEGSGVIKQRNILQLNLDFGKALFMSANTKATIEASSTSTSSTENNVGIKLVRALTNVHL